MTDRPIIFSGPMVRALLHGRKTQTRRMEDSPLRKCVPGDRLWVRESWKVHSIYNHLPPRDVPRSKVFYLADDGYAPRGSCGRPSIFLPRWASRMTLVVTDVRFQVLQDIAGSDAIAEGIARTEDSWWSGAPGQASPSAVGAFALLWNGLHGEQSWDDNPKIVALTFTVHQLNIDEMPKREAVV